MPKNNWFDEIFLPSIFEYVQKSVGLCKNCKISDKQFEICRQNMEEVNTYDINYGVSYTYYIYVWNGRKVIVTRYTNSYISFSLNSTESEQARQEEEKAREAEKLERLERIKQNPERLKKSLSKKLEKLENLKNELQEAIADQEDADIIDSIKDDILKLQNDIDYLQN